MLKKMITLVYSNVYDRKANIVNKMDSHYSTEERDTTREVTGLMNSRARHETALSTRFSAGGSSLELLDLVDRSGVDYVVVGGRPAAMEALFEALRSQRSAVPLWAVETPEGDQIASAPSISAIDGAERSVAVERAEWALTSGAAIGARHLIVDLGDIRSLQRDWIAVRDLFQRGRFDARSARRFMEMRLHSSAQPLDMARRSLERLIHRAEEEGVSMLLRNPRRVIGLPAVRELEPLLRDFAGAPLGTFCDVPAAHLQELMGFAPMELTTSTFGGGPAWGFGDACGPIGALAPGRGVLDCESLARRIPDEGVVCFVPWGGLSPNEVIEGARAVHALFASGVREAV
jgi:hypothetical protein